MHSLMFFNLCMLLPYLTLLEAYFNHSPEELYDTNNITDGNSFRSKSILFTTLNKVSTHNTDYSNLYNTSLRNREEQRNSPPSQTFINGTDSPTDLYRPSSVSSHITESIHNSPKSSYTPTEFNIRSTETVTKMFNNESHLSSSEQYSTGDSSAIRSSIKTSSKFANVATTPSSYASESLSQEDDGETEGVIIIKPAPTRNTATTTAQPKTIYKRILDTINDAYILSILLPVAAGIIFASTIIVIIATCRCLRRQYRRRRIQKKSLPDSVKNLRPSDRARLLQESSDEEF